MIFHAVNVLLFLFQWQSIGCKNIENLSIERILDQVAIPTNIINNFLHKPAALPSQTINPNERIDTSVVHYENSNGFIPLVVSTQSYERRKDKKNITNSSIDTLDESNLETKNPLENNQSFLNLPNSSKNRRLFNERSNQNEFELLKVGNETPPIANYSSFFENSQEFSLPDTFHVNTNLTKSVKVKRRERRNRIKNYLNRHDSINKNNRHQLHSGPNEHRQININHQEEEQIYYNPEIIRNYYSQKTLLPKTNHNALSIETANLQSNGKTEKKEEYNMRKPTPKQNEQILQFNDQSTEYITSTLNPYTNSKNKIDSTNLEEGVHKPLSHVEWMNRNYEFSNSRDSSEENSDYSDEIEKSRRIEKTIKERPRHFSLLRKTPKEHRQAYVNAFDDQGRKYSRTRSKSRLRQKPRPAQLIKDDDKNENEESNSNENTNVATNEQNSNKDNAWNQISPNVEVSRSNSFEINQIEKPKLHIVPLNLLSNFDHATALDNSQGFDITNAMITGFVPEGSLISTVAPLLSSSANYIISSTAKPQLDISTEAADIIVGQSSFHNPVQTVLNPNKLQQNLFNHYLQSTVAPTVFAITHHPDHSTSSIIPNLQQTLDKIQSSFPTSQQLITNKPIHQSLANLLQTAESSVNTQSLVSSNAAERKKLHSQRMIQPTTSRSHTNMFESKKKKFNSNSGEFLASASLSVDANVKDDNSNINSNTKSDNNFNSQSNQQISDNFNTLLQSTMVPAILHTGIGLINNQNQHLITNPLFLTNPQANQQLIKVSNALQNSVKQLQYDIQNNRYQLASIPGIDNNGAASNAVGINHNFINQLQKAQLPILGTNNVEIVNPNLNANPYSINQIPAALVTTPIPIVTTAGLLTTKQFLASTQEPVDNRPLYNPINFLPNYELIRNQSFLNSNIRNDNKNYNFIPLVSIGNQYKNSQKTGDDFKDKHRLSLDLEKYAEEMFKESLRTIYNSHKWNNDPPSLKNVSLVDNSDFAKLRNELLRIKNNMRDSKFSTDVLEAHHTENKIRTTNPGYDYNKPDSSFEQHKYGNKPYSDVAKKPQHHSHHYRHKFKINDFLTPPKINSFVSKNPLHDKLPKKRPSQGSRLNTRPRPRQGVISYKSKGTEAKASTIAGYRYPLRLNQDNSPYSPTNYNRDLQSYNYPSLIGSISENDNYRTSSDYSSLEKDYYDINHPRTHNLFGLLMKNTQLPPGRPNNYRKQDKSGVSMTGENKWIISQDHEKGFQDV
ncbi:PREDICTED: uncharacterized protein LOC105359961 [Ceratosolen solmsi marchali]|uniref:Uncharacterized protein LOC105359961 n=1 Tax=Ceratosolen solmsi marchali TaxID=326594 RepID=A0AAJ6VMF7_9HYME|nr:PREDICTED: uncharacterized protein LOC105359961 [Ceratosolen solmsi marchali]